MTQYANFAEFIPILIEKTKNGKLKWRCMTGGSYGVRVGNAYLNLRKDIDNAPCLIALQGNETLGVLYATDYPQIEEFYSLVCDPPITKEVLLKNFADDLLNL